ncbi:hypothetical protein DFP72DRAFT_846439 [Ephemerocybe angulata]|uniref:Endonuclease/exonuclease/phosphatase domain-containing protein n=1 Tax=Ephemerocybe angulata TaxID=980116 RepID=A0A8H6I0P5_9AGAR|nr:hypothetical protein DFP72DRAFT_846439 [Tulosesus angulatus]
MAKQWRQHQDCDDGERTSHCFSSSPSNVPSTFTVIAVARLVVIARLWFQTSNGNCCRCSLTALQGLDGTEEGIPGFRRHFIERESLHRHLDGGVAVFVQDSIQLEKSELLSSPDVLVLDLQEMMVVAAYILPRNSPTYEGVGDPYDSLEKLLAVCGEEAKPAVIVGDLNARVGVNDLRMSDNKVASKQGESLLDSCNKMGMQIFNGMFPNSGLSTSHSPGHGHSVVDLVIGNRSVLVVDMRIGSQWSMGADSGKTLSTDHSEVFLDLFNPRQFAGL